LIYFNLNPDTSLNFANPDLVRLHLLNICFFTKAKDGGCLLCTFWYIPPPHENNNKHLKGIVNIILRDLFPNMAIPDSQRYPYKFCLINYDFDFNVNLHIYFARLSVCLFVCFYPINVKTAEPIGLKFFVVPHVAPGKVYKSSKFQKVVFKSFFIYLKRRNRCAKILVIWKVTYAFLLQAKNMSFSELTL